jgi:hypothetical protein
VGHGHGYDDFWDGAALFYVGEGQRGDQQFIRGNKAILEHRKNGCALRVFKGAGGLVQYLGEFEIDRERPFAWDFAPETGGGRYRRVIRFRLVPKRLASTEAETVSRSYIRADENVHTSAPEPFSRDPNEIDRALAAHAATQNALYDFLNQRGVSAWSPGPTDPDFDIAWKAKRVTWVAEVKTLPQNSETRQLRLGLGQVLHYQDLLLTQDRNVRAALVVANPPTNRQWVDLCLRHGVSLIWKDTFEQLLR